MRTPVGSSNTSARSSLENSPAAAPSGVTFTVWAPTPTLQKTHASTATDHRRCLAMVPPVDRNFPVRRPDSARIIQLHTALGTKFLSLRVHQLPQKKSIIRGT